MKCARFLYLLVSAKHLEQMIVLVRSDTNGRRMMLTARIFIYVEEV